MTFIVTPLYTAILAIFMVVLSIAVSKMRTDTGISIMHAGNMDLALAIRRHGNFIEAIPMALILMALAEAGGAGHFWLHAMGISLVAARILHVLGLSKTIVSSPVRMAGGIFTQLAMFGAVGFLLWNYFT